MVDGVLAGTKTQLRTALLAARRALPDALLVLVAGRKRVPRPAAGTIAVRGIGTRGGVIFHTLTAT